MGKLTLHPLASAKLRLLTFLPPLPERSASLNEKERQERQATVSLRKSRLSSTLILVISDSPLRCTVNGAPDTVVGAAVAKDC